MSITKHLGCKIIAVVVCALIYLQCTYPSGLQFSHHRPSSLFNYLSSQKGEVLKNDHAACFPYN